MGGRPSKQPISRDAELVGVHWKFGVRLKVLIDNEKGFLGGYISNLISGWLIR